MTDEKPTVAFQGEPGAYSEAAVLEYFGGQARPLPCASFEQAFAAVQGGQAALGMLPIENSLAGSIHRNYDLMLEHDLHIVGEHYLRVKHCLVGLPSAEIGQVKKVISHPQALAQCDHTLRAMQVITEPVYDTAGSVKMVKAGGDPGVAAIASSRAAEVYGMKVLREGIEDNPANYTRFLALSRQAALASENAKTSIVFSLKNVPGALFKALSVFALREIDLSKIESRPLAGQPWDYLFYIDFLASADEPNGRRALEHLGEMAASLRVLGVYPRHENWQASHE